MKQEKIPAAFTQGANRISALILRYGEFVVKDHDFIRRALAKDYSRSVKSSI